MLDYLDAIHAGKEGMASHAPLTWNRTWEWRRWCTDRDSEAANGTKVRRQWKKQSGHHQQARIENTFFRYKTTIGDRLRARHPTYVATADALLAELRAWA